MTGPTQSSSAKDKTLFTPGPLTTSQNVKQAMLRDLGSRDIAFIEVVSHIRQTLLAIAGVSSEKGYEAVLMQGLRVRYMERLLAWLRSSPTQLPSVAA